MLGDPEAASSARASLRPGLRPDVTPEELFDAVRVLQDLGWAGGMTMGDAIRGLADKRDGAAGE